MLYSMKTLMCASVLTTVLGVAAAAQQLQQGTYRGDTQYNTSVGMTIQGNRASIWIGADRCLGEFEGRLARNPAGQLFLVADDYAQSQCAVAIIPDSTTSFRTEQGPECSYHHGAACDFNAYLKLQR